MTDRRLQVFVSSTFTDLIDERQEVLRCVLNLKCFPAGMELFPASDQEQMQFIRSVIDDCDIYVLVVAGRYGSTPDGSTKSFTETEYEYAKARGIPILAFLHADPSGLAAEKQEDDRAKHERLQEFRETLAKGRVVGFWKDSKDLGLKVVYALVEALKLSKAQGWVRGGEQSPEVLLEKLEALRTENESLRLRIEERQTNRGGWRSELADGAAEVVLEGTYHHDGLAKAFAQGRVTETDWQLRTSWDEILAGLGPDLLQTKHESAAKRLLSSWAMMRLEVEPKEATISRESFNSVKIQLLALEYLNVADEPNSSGAHYSMWTLSPAGRERLLRIRAARAARDVG